jgi:itaconyl-CoA hydratase
MSDPDFKAFPLRPKGRAYQDFEPGQVFGHHWGRTLGEGDNALFATVALRYTPLYFNAEYARAHGHSGVVIDPLLVLCTVVGLSVEDLSEAGGPFLGIDDVVFHHPVYAGDTLTARSTVAGMRESEKRPQFGIVTWRTEGENQKGRIVVSYRRTNLIAKRQESRS